MSSVYPYNDKQPVRGHDSTNVFISYHITTNNVVIYQNFLKFSGHALKSYLF